MRTYLLEFLKGLEQAVPPPSGGHHGIGFCRYGSDADGWQDRLGLHVNLGKKFQTFFIEEDDLINEDPQDFVANVVSELKKAGFVAKPEMRVATNEEVRASAERMIEKHGKSLERLGASPPKEADPRLIALVNEWRERAEAMVYGQLDGTWAIHQCADQLEARLSALQPPKEADRWQPIEDPPPSARTVLLTNGYNVSSGFFAATDRKPRWHDPVMQNYSIPATHWMRLPDPPVSALQREPR